MDCNHIRQNLLDRDWTVADIDAVRRMIAHLDACPACREAHQAYDRLRNLLHDDDEIPAPPSGWLAFQTDLRTPPVRKTVSRARWPLAMAAAVVLLLIGYSVAILVGNRANRFEEAPMADLRISREDATTHAAAFRQVADVFDHRTRWLMLSEHGSGMGISQEPLPPVRRLLLIRLVLKHDGSAATTSDVVIVPGQSAELRVPLADGLIVHYHLKTASTATSRLSVWAELAQSDGTAEPLAALATQLNVSPGQSTRAGELNTISGPYQLSVAFAQVDMGAQEVMQ